MLSFNINNTIILIIQIIQSNAVIETIITEEEEIGSRVTDELDKGFFQELTLATTWCNHVAER